MYSQDFNKYFCRSEGQLSGEKRKADPRGPSVGFPNRTILPGAGRSAPTFKLQAGPHLPPSSITSPSPRFGAPNVSFLATFLPLPHSSIYTSTLPCSFMARLWPKYLLSDRVTYYNYFQMFNASFQLFFCKQSRPRRNIYTEIGRLRKNYESREQVSLGKSSGVLINNPRMLETLSSVAGCRAQGGPVPRTHAFWWRRQQNSKEAASHPVRLHGWLWLFTLAHCHLDHVVHLFKKNSLFVTGCKPGGSVRGGDSVVPFLGEMPGWKTPGHGSRTPRKTSQFQKPGKAVPFDILAKEEV